MALVHEPHLGKMLGHQRPRKEEGGMEDHEALIITVIIPFLLYVGNFSMQLLGGS